MTGVIKSLNFERGFFFVTGEDGIEYFAHRSALSDGHLFNELAKGDTMELLETVEAPRGWRVNKVIPIQ